MMIVQKFCQLLAQAFVAFAFVAEHNRPFEQRVLQIMRKLAPEIGGRRSEDKKITCGIFVGGNLFRWRGHEQSSGQFHKGNRLKWTGQSGDVRVAKACSRSLV